MPESDIREEGIYFIPSRSQPIFEEKQGGNPSRSLKHKQWREAAFWLALWLTSFSNPRPPT